MNSFVKSQTLMIVDDEAGNLTLLSSLLKARYRLKIAKDGAKAMEIALSSDPPDLILLDIVMEGIDGYKVCHLLKNNPKSADIPVIFLTGQSDVADEQRGFEVGAVDYILKPISPPVLLARVATHLQLKAARDFLKDKNAYLEQEVGRRTREIGIVQDVAMVALGSLAETRDNETGNHIRRTQHAIHILAEKLKEHSRFSAYLTPLTNELLYKSAPLHDIGKVGIPDRILLKPDKLTPNEFEIMKTHTTIGRDSILSAERLLPSPNSFLHIAREIAWSHHEKWNGTGYPRGLSGEDIGIPGRLMAVVDVYDALVSKRLYKPPMPHANAVAMIREQSGAHFDPDVVEAFLEVSDQIQVMTQEFVDHSLDQSS